MSLKNTTQRFGAVSKFFHWVIFLLLGLQLALIWLFEAAAQTDPNRGSYMFYHKSFGATILVLVLLWIIWRQFNVLPNARPSGNSWQHTMAKFTHISMLIGVVLMPISGLFMSMANNRGLDFFGLFTVAPFSFIPQVPALAEQFKAAHQLIAIGLLALVILHVLGALVHHFYYKDDVLKRMLP